MLHAGCHPERNAVQSKDLFIALKMYLLFPGEVGDGKLFCAM